MPLSFDSSAQIITLKPTRDDLAGLYTAKQAEFYLKDYPSLIWEVPIEINMEKCVSSFKLVQESVTIDYELGTALDLVQLPQIVASPNCEEDLIVEFQQLSRIAGLDETPLDQLAIFD